MICDVARRSIQAVTWAALTAALAQPACSEPHGPHYPGPTGWGPHGYQPHCNYCVDGQCIPNYRNFGYYPTIWRRWPGDQPPGPRPEEGPGGPQNLPPGVPPAQVTPPEEEDVQPPPAPSAQTAAPAEQPDQAPAPPPDTDDRPPAFPDAAVPERPAPSGGPPTGPGDRPTFPPGGNTLPQPDTVPFNGFNSNSKPRQSLAQPLAMSRPFADQISWQEQPEETVERMPSRAENSPHSNKHANGAPHGDLPPNPRHAAEVIATHEATRQQHRVEDKPPMLPEVATTEASAESNRERAPAEMQPVIKARSLPQKAAVALREHTAEQRPNKFNALHRTKRTPTRTVRPTPRSGNPLRASTAGESVNPLR